MRRRVLEVIGLLGFALCFLGPVSAAPTLEDLFPAEIMQDPSTLDLELVERTTYASQLSPGKVFQRIRIRFTSFQWQGETWRHDASILLPASGNAAPQYQGTLAVVSLQKRIDVKRCDLVEVPLLMGIPCFVIESGNPGPRYGQLKEGEVMLNGMNLYLKTGDPRWIGYVQLGKVIVRAVTAAQTLAARKGYDIQRVVVTGHSKRGVASWIAAAVDDRIVGAMPSGWLAGNAFAFLEHKLMMWGPEYMPTGDPKGPAYVTTAEQIAFTKVPGWADYNRFVDAYYFQDRLVGKKILNTIGTKDPLYPITYQPDFLDALPADSVSHLTVTNLAHGNSSDQQKRAWAMWLAHCLSGRDLSQVVHQVERQGTRCIVTAQVSSSQEVQKLTLCSVLDEDGTFPASQRWTRNRMQKIGTDLYRFEFQIPAGKHAAVFVELCDEDSQGVPGVVTTNLEQLQP